jgi:geranylgeranylglyceryl phosphate synthase family protein
VKPLVQQFLTLKRKRLAVLVDPDKASLRHLETLVEQSLIAGVDCFLVGGSLLTNGQMAETVRVLKCQQEVPVIIFPGHPSQLCDEADALLLLSLISGRNADLLIGQHVLAAPAIRRTGLDILPTGYMLVDGGNITSVMYMSNTVPIPYDKPDIAVCTAMAGEMLGLQHLYLEAGSGAKRSVAPEMIAAVREVVNAFIWTGGGIRTPEAALSLAAAGADCLVVGTAAEDDATALQEIAAAVRSVQPILHN